MLRVLIEILAQLDRHLPKDKYETKKFQKLIKSYILSSSAKANGGMILHQLIQK